MRVDEKTKWNINNVPATTKEEWGARRAAITFDAETTLKEKATRVFNASVFTCATIAKLAPYAARIPGVAEASSVVGMRLYTYIGGAALMQIPLVANVVTVALPILVTVSVILTIRKILAVALTHIVYPATFLSYVPNFVMSFLHTSFAEERMKFIDEGASRGLGTLHRVTLNKSGVNYDAFMAQHQENAPWIIVAGGNGQIGEDGSFIRQASESIYRGFNTLYINGPGIGDSSGFTTSYAIGAGQEAGLQFLEKVVKTKNILAYGYSLGGGAQAEAVCSHTFKEDVNYMVWSDRSFSTISNAASGMVTRLAKPVFFLLGIELDGVAGAKRLQELKIRHIVTQNTRTGVSATDGVIPNSASLLTGLKDAGIDESENLSIFGDKSVTHCYLLPRDIVNRTWNAIHNCLG